MYRTCALLIVIMTISYYLLFYFIIVLTQENYNIVKHFVYKGSVTFYLHFLCIVLYAT